MNFNEADRRFAELKKQRDRGRLSEDAFRVEVAELLLRDAEGAFWMLDPDEGRWFCNRGDGWAPADPSAEPHAHAWQAGQQARGRRTSRRWLVTLGVLVAVLLAVAAAAWWGWPPTLWNPFAVTPTPVLRVQVSIASPAEGSEVAVGQAVAFECTVQAAADLRIVDYLVLDVNGQEMDSQSIRNKIQPGQTALPLSLTWRPTAVGEHRIVVAAFGREGLQLGSASTIILVTETPVEALPEPICRHDATFLNDVTIPAGSAFPPGARMEKVWEVLNSGSCAWGVGYELILVNGEGMGAPRAVRVPATAAAETMDLAVTLWAPIEAGTYSNSWQLRSPGGELFGPTLPLTVQVEVQAQESTPPAAPANLSATTVEGASAVQLAWSDRSDNEDAFRIYRQDVDASIGLAPANVGTFLDEQVACGNTYRYLVVAFNAAGTSAISAVAEVSLPPCAPANRPPAISVTTIPTQVLASQTFTIAFEARDDTGLDLVIVWGEETRNIALDSGRVFTCTEEVVCTGTWSIAWSGMGDQTLTLLAIARDSSGQESGLVRTNVSILASEPPAQTPGVYP